VGAIIMRHLLASDEHWSDPDDVRAPILFPHPLKAVAYVLVEVFTGQLHSPTASPFEKGALGRHGLANVLPPIDRNVLTLTRRVRCASHNMCVKCGLKRTPRGRLPASTPPDAHGKLAFEPVAAAGEPGLGIGAAIGMDANEMVSAGAMSALMMAAVVTAPIVLAVLGVVVLAVSAPFLPTRRRRSAMEAIAALIRLVRVLRAK
jgi:hypothetical protein